MPETRDQEIARLRDAISYYERLMNIPQPSEGAEALHQQWRNARQRLADLTDFRLW